MVSANDLVLSVTTALSLLTTSIGVMAEAGAAARIPVKTSGKNLIV